MLRIVTTGGGSGDYEKFLGKVQERYGDKKEEILKWADQWHNKPAFSGPVQPPKRMPAASPAQMNHNKEPFRTKHG